MQKLRALVVDDSRVMRILVMKALQECPIAEFEFVEAADGEEAIEKLATEQLDIAFVDWNMPKLSGIDFARYVKSLAPDRRIPVIMVSSESSCARIGEAMEEVGVDGYICKPFRADHMLKTLDKVLKSSSSRTARPSSLLGRLFS